MNLHAIRFLIWEQLTRTYRIWLGALAGVFATCLSSYIFLSRIENVSHLDVAAASQISIAGIALALSIYLLGLLFAHGDDQDLQLDMPRYLMRLPLNTSTLVFFRLGFDVLSVALLTGASMCIFVAFFDAQMEAEMPFLGFVMTFTSIVAALRTVAWTVGQSGTVFTTFVSVTLYVTLNRILDALGWWPVRQDKIMVLFTFAVVTCSFLLSYLAVHTHRRGRLAILEDLGERFAGHRRRGQAELPPFASQDQALRWYESRRQARIYPGLVFILFAGVFFIGAGKDIAHFIKPYEDSLNLILIVIGEILFVTLYGSLIVATLLTGGIFLFQNYRAYGSGAKTFLFIRPASTSTLSSARIAAILKSLVVTFIPVLALTTVVFIIDHGSTEASTFRTFINDYYGWDGVIIAILSLIGVMAAIWVGLWLGNLIAFLMLFALATMFLEYTPMFRETHELVRGIYGLRVTAVLSLIVVATLFIAAKRKGLLDARYLTAGFLATPLIALGFLMCLNLETLDQGGSMDYSYLTYSVPAALFLPLTPLLTVPLFMHWARHR